MRRGAIFLVAAFFEVLRFFALMLFAEAIGFLESGALTPALLRYIAAPQLLFVVAFFFLWTDGNRYASYRPLALVGKVLALAASAPLLLAFLGSLRNEGFIPLPRFALASAFFIVVSDLFGLLVLILYRRVSSGGISVSPVLPAESGNAAQHGPNDIEKVEDLT